ncbi:MAG: hypothetical protein EBS29_09505, partial [Chloroflexia bacterium]|nr:hypothetical protein [Chloroflexia bacterium]
MGISNINDFSAALLGSTATSYAYYSNGNKYNNGSATSYGAGFFPNDVIGVALDLDAGTLVFYKNGASQGTAFSSLSGTFFPASSTSDSGGGYTHSCIWNCGQRPFAYTAPSGFKALCTANLPAPLVTKPSTVFDVKLYTGNAGTQTISGLGFSPDLIWTKSRSQAYSHNIYDIVRGVSKNLFVNETSAENTDANTIKAFNSDGFQLGSNDNGNYTNGGSAVAWAWDAGSSTVTNTQGSITSSVRANATAGFSVVTYTGNGTLGATFGHGLGVAPSFFVIKRRSASSDWAVYHKSVGATQFLTLNSTAAATTSVFAFNNTAPSSTVITIDGYGGEGFVNANGATYVCYAFAP